MAATIQARTRPSEEEDTPSVEVLLFTDPYSSWCWAMEPVWLHLKEAYGHQAGFRIVLGGLLENAAGLFDEGRMAWLRHHLDEVANRSGQPIDPAFLDDIGPDFSTWPACIHVKAAQAQGEDIGQRFLRRLRRLTMTEQGQGSDPGQAGRVGQDVEGLDTTRWRGQLADGTALQDFLHDRRLCQETGIHGFPTLVMQSSDPRRAPKLSSGYRPYADVDHTLRLLAPWLQPRPPRPIIDLLFDHGAMTTREIQEIQGTSPRETLDALDGLAAEGTVLMERRAGGAFWSLAEG